MVKFKSFTFILDTIYHFESGFDECELQNTEKTIKLSISKKQPMPLNKPFRELLVFMFHLIEYQRLLSRLKNTKNQEIRTEEKIKK